jgi:pimeloyl-ACP methyl ester carboxylesterase
MGGTVAISLALTKPERVSRVIVVGSPIMGNSLNIFLRLAGKPLIAGVVWHLPVALKFGIKFFSPYIVKDWQKWYQMITRDLSSTTLEAFFSSINSLRQTDLRAELSTTATPIMGIYGVGDNVVSPNQASIIMKYASIPRVKMMDDCKHFPMLDAPQAFNDNLADFLAWEFVPPNSK